MILEKSVCFIDRNFRMWLSWHLVSKLYKFQRRYPFEWCGVDAFASSLLTIHSPSLALPILGLAKRLQLTLLWPQCNHNVFGMVVAGLNAFQLLPQKDGKQVWVC